MESYKFSLIARSSIKKTTRALNISRFLVLTILTISLGALPATAMAVSQKLHVDGGASKFLAVGRPSLLKIRGEGKPPVGDLEMADGNVTGTLTVDINSFATGIEMRDHHMKEKYLEVGKFPNATLSVKKAAVGDLASLPKDIDFEGDLTLHGVTQPVKGLAHLTKDAQGVSFNAKFPVKITDHKIDIPSYGGIKIADEVTVEIDSKAKTVSK